MLDASTVSGRTFVSVSASTAFFTFGFSTTASPQHPRGQNRCIPGLAEWWRSRQPVSDHRFCRVPSCCSAVSRLRSCRGLTIVADIFHHNRHAFPRRLVSDTAAHNASAQDGSGLFRGLNIFGQFFAFALTYGRSGNADQRAGLIGMGQRDKAFIFQQGFFTTKRAAASMVLTAVIGAG